jgi:hypothetical protein
MKKKPNKEELYAAKNIFDAPIGVDIHAEYIELCGKMGGTLSKEELVLEAKKLALKRTPLAEKKNALLYLAHGNTLRSLYAIQRYLKNPDPELATWASLAWQECQNAVLNEGMKKLMGDDAPEADMIIGGMGAERDRMRYCFVVSTLGGRAFTKGEQEKVVEMLKKVESHHDAKTEQLDWCDNYVKITALISWEVAVGDYIEALINWCNASSLFLHFHYFVANTHDLTKKEIAEYLAELKDAT